MIFMNITGKQQPLITNINTGNAYANLTLTKIYNYNVYRNTETAISKTDQDVCYSYKIESCRLVLIRNVYDVNVI